MRTFSFDTPHVSAWVASRLEKETPWVGHQAIGVCRDGVLVGGVVIDKYEKEARCSLNAAGEDEHWLTKTFIRMVFQYAFDQLNCNIIVNTVDSDNVQSIALTTKLGFTHVCTIPNGCAGADLLIFTMSKADCRWLTPKVNKHG